MDITEVLNERQKTHGDFEIQSNLSQKLKEIFNDYSRTKLTYEQKEAIDMILHKIARIGAGNPSEPDHWRDISGYATLVLNILERKSDE